MPAGRGSLSGDSGGNGVKRETFRPPWVKEGPDALPPKPSNFANKSSKARQEAEGNKTSTVKTSQLNKSQENGAPPPAKDSTFVKPQLKPVPPKDPQSKLQSREIKIPVKLNSVADRQYEPRKSLTSAPSIEESTDYIDKAIPATRNALLRQDSLKKMAGIPVAPPMPPKAPPMPRPADAKPLTDKQQEIIESLKTRPKVRPDWTSLLKEVESGKKLKHVQCNDRSQPILCVTKAKGQFLFESEKDNAHNQLLKQIQQGINLKRVKTNDRSKPVLEGLRKFRRQMTIEEQIIKSQSMASMPPEELPPDEEDELDDIDRIRDDLQSTKQLLALELRNKEAQIRENKRLQTRIQQLEAELDKERGTTKKPVPTGPTDADEKLIKSLKCEAAEARKTAEDLEKKYQFAADQLDRTKSELEEIRKQKQMLERNLEDNVFGGKRFSISDRKGSTAAEESDIEDEIEESETESEGSDNEEKKERKAQREVKLLRNKLRNYKNKEDNAKKERMALKTQIKQLQAAMKDEKKKFKALQKEVDKMASMMKDVGSDEDEEDEEEEEPAEEKEETETETESESESESSETESDSEKSVSEPEDAPAEKKKENLGKRMKKHENRLLALKKGNFMFKTSVERLQDDLNKQKEMSLTIQQDLDSVLAELG